MSCYHTMRLQFFTEPFKCQFCEKNMLSFLLIANDKIVIITGKGMSENSRGLIDREHFFL